MTNQDFKAWLVVIGRGKRVTDAAAGRLLGISRNTVAGYRTDTEVPRPIALACAALAFGLPEWKRPDPKGMEPGVQLTI